ncbi:hypothetical protein [Grimontia celer]|uniref:hypothetical protein n=1 Tax=Grimontia celer TaxID=1796497 RepID=UPI001E334BB4|nr:hypothetical protein [Grimontia celer]
MLVVAHRATRIGHRQLVPVGPGHVPVKGRHLTVIIDSAQARLPLHILIRQGHHTAVTLGDTVYQGGGAVIGVGGGKNMAIFDRFIRRG